MLLTNHQSFLIRTYHKCVVRMDSGLVHFVIAVLGEMSEHHMYLVFHFSLEAPNVIQHLWILWSRATTLTDLVKSYKMSIQCPCSFCYFWRVSYMNCQWRTADISTSRTDSVIDDSGSKIDTSFVVYFVFSSFSKIDVFFFDQSTHRNIRRQKADTSSQDLSCRD